MPNNIDTKTCCTLIVDASKSSGKTIRTLTQLIKYLGRYMNSNIKGAKVNIKVVGTHSTKMQKAIDKAIAPNKYKISYKIINTLPYPIRGFISKIKGIDKTIASNKYPLNCNIAELSVDHEEALHNFIETTKNTATEVIVLSDQEGPLKATQLSKIEAWILPLCIDSKYTLCARVATAHGKYQKYEKHKITGEKTQNVQRDDSLSGYGYSQSALAAKVGSNRSSSDNESNNGHCMHRKILDKLNTNDTSPCSTMDVKSFAATEIAAGNLLEH